MCSDNDYADVIKRLVGFVQTMLTFFFIQESIVDSSVATVVCSVKNV